MDIINAQKRSRAQVLLPVEIVFVLSPEVKDSRRSEGSPSNLIINTIIIINSNNISVIIVTIIIITVISYVVYIYKYTYTHLQI